VQGLHVTGERQKRRRLGRSPEQQDPDVRSETEERKRRASRRQEP
jgi:hypothetical protein